VTRDPKTQSFFDAIADINNDIQVIIFHTFEYNDLVHRSRTCIHTSNKKENGTEGK
jgi:hypothetical protein